MSEVITVDQALWGLLVAQILPILVGLVTDRVAGALKTWLLMILSAVVTWADEVAAAGSFVLDDAVLRFALLFLTAVGSYFGWQKRTISPLVQEKGLHLGGGDGLKKAA